MGIPIFWLETKPPWIHLGVCTPEQAEESCRNYANSFASVPEGVFRKMRGQKCRTAHALFDEFAAALQFPGYFGENWDALNDCLSDLSWLNAKAVMLAITDAPRLLEAVPPGELHRFAAVLNQVCATWNQGKKPRPLHVMLYASPQEEAAFLKRCASAGLSPQRLPAA